MKNATCTRRHFISQLARTTAGCAALGLTSSLGAMAKAPKHHTNVLFIIADDLCTALGGYRHPQCRTPNLDRLAARGVLFENAYCQYPVCGPSRASLLCGQYPAALNVLRNKVDFRDAHPNLVTLPQFFRNQGYTTARVSKVFHMGIPGDILAGTAGTDDPASWDHTVNIKAAEQYTPGKKEDLCPKVTHQGVDFVKVEAAGDDLVHADGQAAAHAVKMLRQLKDRPFFLAVGMVRPHVPLVAPEASFSDYPHQEMPLANVPEHDLADVPQAAQTQTNAVKYGMNSEQQQKTLAAYYATVSFMDAQVGKILDELERLNLDQNTVIVFTSDHGYNLGQHTSWQKLSLWEDAVRSPLIIAAPGLSPRRTDAIVELTDLYPSLADICGFGIPKGLPGQSVRPLLHGKNWHEKPAYTITRHNGESLRTRRWRYTLWKNGTAGVELYDHATDPGEFTNLAGNPKFSSIQKELHQQLLNARERAAGIPSN